MQRRFWLAEGAVSTVFEACGQIRWENRRVVAVKRGTKLAGRTNYKSWDKPSDSAMTFTEIIFILAGTCTVMFFGVKLICLVMVLAPKLCYPLPESFMTSLGKWAGEKTFFIIFTYHNIKEQKCTQFVPFLYLKFWPCFLFLFSFLLNFTDHTI